MSRSNVSSLQLRAATWRRTGDAVAPSHWPPPGWLIRQLLLPLAMFAIANLWLQAFDGDRLLADRFFAWEGQQWALRNSFLTTSVIHVGGRHASTLAWLAVVVAAAVARHRRGWSQLRRPLFCLALSVLASTALVACLKHVTQMDCPWDAMRYGGSHPLFGLFDARPANLRASGCFPAGHASAGYAWVALYFFFPGTHSAWRWAGLGVGLAAGLVFGISQQLRGAHFLSHDVWSLMLCWLVALAVYRISIAWSLASAALTAWRNATAVARPESRR